MALLAELLERLTSAGFTAGTVPTASVPRDGTLVRGRVTLVDAGSGVARSLVGFGAGQSRFVCEAQLFDLERGLDAPVYTVHVEGGTHGGSRASYPSVADAKDAARRIVTWCRVRRWSRQGSKSW